MSSNNKDYTEAMQDLLYRFPLYDYINRERANILVIGYSDISVKFIDLAFEVAQVSDYKLHITVISENDNAKEKYLRDRPAFTDFFNVDDENVDDDYGSLSFKIIAMRNIENEILEILANDEDNKYAYLFIASDNDFLNSEIAKICVDCRDSLYLNYAINCVSETDERIVGVNYVHMSDSIKNLKEYRTLKSMAFNCHLVWNYSQLLDMRKLQRQFLSNYYYVACLSYVVSLKYKLKSIGIEFLNSSAPEQFDRMVKSKDSSDQKIIEDMVANEHKRWNVNMICRGFRAVESMNKYVNGEQKKANGYHPCLVRSNGKQNLNSDEWKENNKNKWDNHSSKDLISLDDLDRVSVLLHEAYRKSADKIKRENNMPQADVDIIHKLLEGNVRIVNAFDKFYICLQEISMGNGAKVSLYEHYYSKLMKELYTLPSDKEKLVCKRIDALAAPFSAILENEKHIDYKQFDVDLIKKIPFILTYRSNLHIGIPFDLINMTPSINTAAFRIVETALLINPSRITYICEFEQGDMNNLVRMLEYAIKNMDSHYLRSAINICLLTNCSLTESEVNTITDISDRISSVETVKDAKSFVDYSKRRHLRIFESNRTRSSSIIERDEYACRSRYRYNRNKNEFVATNCDEVKYISFVPLLKISDIFETKGSFDDYSLPDMQKDYEFFWKKYKKGDGKSENVWKALCAVLEEQDKDNAIEIKNINGENVQRTYLVEKICFDSIKKLCRQAQTFNNAISCSAKMHSNSSYTVSINAPKEFQEVISDLLCEAYKLYDRNCINVRGSQKKVLLYFDSLFTGKIPAGKCNSLLGDFGVGFSQIKALLDEIEKEGYIRDLYVKEGCTSFFYSTHQVKDVMVQAGRILELFVYYRLLETGMFDDVANSVEIYWGNAEAENEIDVIATKGYKVLLIECKAKTKLSQEFYNKLSRLNSDYGLNSIPVIVADTLELDRFAEDNKQNIELGDRVGIKTVFKKDDISDIGNVLENIVRNN